MTADQTLQLALQHQHAGRWAEAEALYRQMLAKYPNQPDAWHLLGTLAQACGRNDVALELIAKAIALRPAAEYQFNYANTLLMLGRTEEAITGFQKAVELKPDLAEAYYSLGLALKRHGKLDEASTALSRAVSLRPDWAEARNSLGVMLKARGEIGQAIDAYRYAIRLNPNFAEAYSNLGNALKEQGNLAEALIAYRKSLQLKPGSFGVLNSIGLCLSGQQMLDDAINAFRQAIAAKPDQADSYCNLGVALMERGQIEESIAAYQTAIRLNPGVSDFYSNLGIAFNAAGQLDEAVDAFHRAIELNPNFADAHTHLGNVYQDQGRIDEAISAHRRAIQINPKLATAHNNLGLLLKDQGHIEESMNAIRRAVELDPTAADVHSNLMFNLCYIPNYTAQQILTEAKIWAEQHADFLAKEIRPHHNDRSPERRIKIGYVSPDFSRHAVGRFLIPVMDRHNREKFQIHCFYTGIKSDQTTTWFKESADRWFDIRGLSDTAAAQLIRKEQIDILIDLALHTRGNRLQVFARKPAPIQATHLAYCSTSGLAAMDYLLTDRYLLPPGEERFISEQPVWLPASYWCFRPLRDTPELALLPALSCGHITFGCLNSFGKVNSTVLPVWCEILKSVPNSRLLLHAAEGSHRQEARDRLSQADVDPARLDFAAYVPFSQYFQQYNSIDIGLDPFPFAGGTTTCDSLWMGVPVVTLAGQTPVSRGGLSILTNAGLPELVAYSTQDYIRIAVDLANDLPRLAQLRASLREKMQSSPLMNEQQYVADLESAYRTMWQKWCSTVKG